MTAAANPQVGGTSGNATTREVPTSQHTQPCGDTQATTPGQPFVVGRRVKVNDEVRGEFAGKTGVVEQMNDGEIGVRLPGLGLSWFLPRELQP
jgi:hypothetical protein